MAKNIAQIFIPKPCSICATFQQKTLDFFNTLCYNTNVIKGQRSQGCILADVSHTLNKPSPLNTKNFLKKFQKPIDKHNKVCYNKVYQMKERKQTKQWKKSTTDTTSV